MSDNEFIKSEHKHHDSDNSHSHHHGEHSGHSSHRHHSHGEGEHYGKHSGYKSPHETNIQYKEMKKKKVKKTIQRVVFITFAIIAIAWLTVAILETSGGAAEYNQSSNTLYIENVMGIVAEHIV